MEISHQAGELIDMAAADIGRLVIRLGFATVHHLKLEELPQPAPSAVAILNVNGWCSLPDGPRAEFGLCVMLAGRDRNGEMRWACCLSAVSPTDDEQQWVRMSESLLIDSAAVGQTHRIALRVSGGLIPGKEEARPGMAPDLAGK